MSNNMVVDTDIVIDFLRGYAEADSFLRQNVESVAFSAITVAEIYAGAKL